EKANTLLGARGLRRSRLVLGISMPAATDTSGAHATRWLRRLGLTSQSAGAISQTQHDDTLKQLLVVVDQVRWGLSAAGLRARSLAALELRRLIYQFLNPTHSRVVCEPPAW